MPVPTGPRVEDLATAGSLLAISGIGAIAIAHRNGAGALIVGMVLTVAGYLLVRPHLARQRQDAPFPVVAAVLVLAVATGCLTSADSVLTVSQAYLMPVAWMAVRGRLRGLIATALIALGGLSGLVLGEGPSYLPTALATEALIYAFSSAIGLWINAAKRATGERQQLLDELRASQGQLAETSRLAGITAERERLARELHDTVAQSLAGLVMQVESAARALANGRDVAGHLDRIAEQARGALAESRSLIAVTAAIPDSDGLLATLRRLAGRFERETSISVTVTGTEPQLDAETQVVLVRVTQEGLANIRKHADATAVHIDLQQARLTITDDGHGFDTAVASSGFGLASMHDRIALAGGFFEVASTPAGTVLTAQLPTEEDK